MLVLSLVLVLATALAGCSTTGASSQVEDAADAVDAMRECLSARGWEVEVDRDAGSLRFRGAPEEADRYEVDAATCAERLPAPQLSDAGVASLYRQQVATVRCLQDHGFAVPEPVGAEEFAAGIEGDAEPWTAFSRLDVPSRAEWDRAERLCPQPTAP